MADAERFEVLVIGAGPAGIAAAVRAAECGVRVGIIDDNASSGGQIWRGSNDEHGEDAARWSERLSSAAITKLFGMKVFHQPEAGVLVAEGAHDLCELRYTNLVVATGARERFLPFPGWTLPNVMGAGGLQAMVKSGLPIRGKRAVVAGTGPLLLAVAAYLRKQGAEIPVLCEQASLSRLGRFGAALLGHPGKITQALQLKKQLAGIPFAANSWPLAAHSGRALESVTILRNGKTEVIPCDYLACGFHLVPNTELQSLLGCKISGGYVQVDEFQQTSVKGVFCAGEPTGIGGVELALVEGQIAGLAAGGHGAETRQLFGERRKARGFARMLDRAFRSAPGVERLAIRRDDCLSLRGRFVCPPAAASVVARSEVANALRHGTVPGQGLRSGHAVSVSVGPGFSAAAGVPRARGESGRNGGYSAVMRSVSR